MKTKLEIHQLQLLFSEVIRGYSVENIPAFGRVIVKHFCSVDFADIENERLKHFTIATSKKLPTLAESEERAIKVGDWSSSKEREIAQAKIHLENLNLTKRKTILKAQTEALKKEIVIVESNLKKLQAEKAESIGYCAEHYANKKLTEYYIYTSLFHDLGFSQHIFSAESFDNLDEKELDRLVEIYNTVTDKFSTHALKCVALLPMFLNGFYLCDNNPHTYYGRPVIALTNFQIELFSHGRHFKNILSECHDKLPENVLSDPETLLEWYDAQKNAEKLMEKSNNRTGGATSIVGATAEDNKRLGRGDVVNFAAETAKHGGSMSFEDILKFHGEMK